MTSPITTSLTDTQLEEAFVTYGAYLEENSTSKAATFITVCTVMMLRPSAVGKGGFSAAWNRESLYQMREDARKWLEARDTSYRAGPTVRQATFKDFRG